MGILMFTARIHDLMYRKHDIEYRMTKLQKRIRDLQKYSTMIGKGQITIGDLLSQPASTMGRSMQYLAFAHNSAMQYVNQNAPYWQQFYMQQQGGIQSPEQQQMMQNWIMKQLYIQAREQAKQVEEKNLNDMEEELKAEKDKLQTENDEIDAELKATKSARDAEIKDWAPKYTGSGG